MNEWINVNEKLPKEGKIVDIAISGGNIIRNVLYKEGRFWKKRKGKNAGVAWSVTHWIPIEKKKTIGEVLKAKDEKI